MGFHFSHREMGLHLSFREANSRKLWYSTWCMETHPWFEVIVQTDADGISLKKKNTHPCIVDCNKTPLYVDIAVKTHHWIVAFVIDTYGISFLSPGP